MLELNAEQRRAVEHGEGPLLVVAGPGTGKTRVITQRIVHLLERGSYSASGDSPGPENILALTFTEKAAAEMKHRVAAALPALTTLPAVSTFHAFCYQILCQHHVEQRLLDKLDVWIFLRRRMAELELEFYQKLAEPGAFLHDLNDFFSRCQDELIEPADFERHARDCERQFLACHPRFASFTRPDGHSLRAAEGLAGSSQDFCVSQRDHMTETPPAGEGLEWEEILKKKELARVFRNSRKLIESAGASSLGSLVSETVALWRRQPAVLDEARARFRCVLVDEFQDTNYAQVELLKLLVAPPFRITAVGDDDQAIYRFRGASHGTFEMFSRAFPGHPTVYLSQNYRSTQKILRVAGAVIGHNDRYAQKPSLRSRNQEGCPIYLLKSQNAFSEALWVADEIGRLARQSTLPGEMAVLYRAHSYRDLLVEEFRRRNIPFAIRGLSILSSAFLRDVVAYLKIIHSPRENISFTRVLLAPRWRFPETLAQAVRQQAARDHCSLHDVIQSPSPAIRQDLSQSGWKDLENLLRRLRRFSKTSSMTALLDRLIEGLGWHYFPDDLEPMYLEAFRKFLVAWEEKSETRRLAEFIEYFDYFVEAGGKIEAPEAAGPSNSVQMMTIHGAKGLEFPVVFIISVSPRRFPATERKAVIEFPATLRHGPPPPRNIHLQEERRLFFVALTRAQERLYVSSVSKSERQSSRFIDDLLSDPAMAARDIERVEVPNFSPGEERWEASSRSPGAEGKNPAAAGPPFSSGMPVPLSGTSTPAKAVPAVQEQLFESVAGPRRRSILADWVRRAPNVPCGEKLRLSATSIQDYLDCPLKYKFRDLLKVPAGPQAALTFGNLMHQSVRHYFEARRNSLPAFEAIEKFYSEHWKSLGFDDAYQEETYRKAGLEQLRGFVERYNAVAVDCQKIQMERNFRLDLGDVVLEGRIDQINLLDPIENGTAELIDYKTGRPRSEKDAEKSVQLSVYALAARKVLGLNPVRLTFYNLTSNQPVSTVRTAEDLDNALRTVHEVSAEIRSAAFNPTPGFVCRWCDFKPLCPAHED